MRSVTNGLRFGLVVLAAVGLIGCAGVTDDGSGSGSGSGSGGPGTPPTTSSAYLKASNPDAGDQLGFSVALSDDGNTLVAGAPLESSGASGINGNQGDNGISQAGAVYVYARSGGSWSQEAYIKASNPNASDQFGLSVALSADGHTLAVGTSLEDSNATGFNGNQADESASQSGAVYVFARSGVTWSQQAYIKASNTEAGDEFGLAIALSGDGNTLAVGARLEDSNATGIGGNQSDNLAPQSGAVYVFTRGGNIWTQQAYVKASNTESNDWFGGSLALSDDGNTMSVGARQEDSSATGINAGQGDNLATDSGAVYLFTRNAGTWSQQDYLKASNSQANDLFGVSVTLSGDGNTLAVAACCEDGSSTGINGNQADNGASGSGAVFVFTRTANVWSQQAYVKSTNTGSGDQFGLTLLLSRDGNTVIVGSAQEDSAIDKEPSDDSLGDSGAVYVLTRSGGTWSHQRFLKASNANSNNHFGSAVGASGNGATVAVGAPLEDSNAAGIDANRNDNSALDAGAVYVY